MRASITADAAGAVVEDPGSKNGMRVNGARVDARVTLTDGDELRVGVLAMTYAPWPLASRRRSSIR